MRNAAKVAECLAAHVYKVFAGEDKRNNDALYLFITPYQTIRTAANSKTKDVARSEVKVVCYGAA